MSMLQRNKNEFGALRNCILLRCGNKELTHCLQNSYVVAYCVKDSNYSQILKNASMSINGIDLDFSPNDCNGVINEVSSIGINNTNVQGHLSVPLPFELTANHNCMGQSEKETILTDRRMFPLSFGLPPSFPPCLDSSPGDMPCSLASLDCMNSPFCYDNGTTANGTTGGCTSNGFHILYDNGYNNGLGYDMPTTDNYAPLAQSIAMPQDPQYTQYTQYAQYPPSGAYPACQESLQCPTARLQSVNDTQQPLSDWQSMPQMALKREFEPSESSNGSVQESSQRPKRLTCIPVGPTQGQNLLNSLSSFPNVIHDGSTNFGLNASVVNDNDDFNDFNDYHNDYNSSDLTFSTPTTGFETGGSQIGQQAAIGQSMNLFDARRLDLAAPQTQSYMQGQTDTGHYLSLADFDSSKNELDCQDCIPPPTKRQKN